MQKKKVFYLLIVSIILIAVYLIAFRDPVLAQVGAIKIYKSETQFRDQLIRLEFPDEKRSMGLYQLIKSAINQEILTNNQVPFPDEIIDLEEARLDKNTKAPEQLQKIKSIFAKDHKAYRKVFVLPTLVNRIIYKDFFLKNQQIHAQSFQIAEALIQKSTSQSETFETLAKGEGLEVRKLGVSEKNGIQLDKKNRLKNLQPENPDRPLSEAAKNLLKIAESLKVGEVFQKPVDQGSNWIVLHYLGKDKDSLHRFEMALVKKIEFQKWYEAEKAKVEIHVYDTSLPVP